MAVDRAVNERKRLVWRGGAPIVSSRVVAEETGIALTYCGSTYAVMMATPADLEDFAIGFSITEGIVERADEIDSIELIESDLGIEVRMWLDADRAQNLVARRRAIAFWSSTVMTVLSPGITISTPSSSSIEPVTSVVRK